MTNPMILARRNDGLMYCVCRPDDWDGEVKTLWLPIDAEGQSWEILEERDGPPPEHSDWVDGVGFVLNKTVRDFSLEQSRLAGLSRIEFMAEVDAKMQAAAEAHAVEIASLSDEIAKRDVQIAELSAGQPVTPIEDVAITPTDPATIMARVAPETPAAALVDAMKASE